MFVAHRLELTQMVPRRLSGCAQYTPSDILNILRTGSDDIDSVHCRSMRERYGPYSMMGSWEAESRRRARENPWGVNCSNYNYHEWIDLKFVLVIGYMGTLKYIVGWTLQLNQPPKLTKPNRLRLSYLSSIIVNAGYLYGKLQGEKESKHLVN